MIFLGAGLIVAIGLGVYFNSLSAPFLFDDKAAIVENASLQRLGSAWFPPHGGTSVSGRPLVNFSLALNRAWSSQAVQSYHALNLAAHLLAGLTLFGLARRTLLRPVLRERFGATAMPLGLAIALLWIAHPLQTEPVVNVAYRAELFVGLFCLLTLYCLLRGAESPSPGRWSALAVASCLAGMASKEVMVSAPLLALLYDRAFVAGTFREAWRQRRGCYLGLAATWLLLAYLIAGMGAARGVSAGFGLGITAWNYALTQCQAIVHYLRLALWPSPLVFDYGISVVTRIGEVLPQALLVLLLVIGTAIALRRRPAVGFLGAWFFALLAPSSSVVPIVSQTMAERRMYLPLAAILVLGVTGLCRLIGRRALVVGFALVPGLAWLTLNRTATYRNEEALWIDTIAHRPQNARAHHNLGVVQMDQGRFAEAIATFETALQLEPDYTDARVNLGAALGKTGRLPEAIKHFEAALRLEPHRGNARVNLGSALVNSGRAQEAIPHLEQALADSPGLVEAHAALGAAFLQIGNTPAAIREFEAAATTDPRHFTARYNLAVVLLQSGRAQEAIVHLEQAIQLKPEFAAAHYNLAVALQRAGRISEAIRQYEENLRLDPHSIDARKQLERLRRQ